MTDDEILSLLSYRRPEIEHQVISASAAPPDEAPLDFKNLRRESLGQLGTLPLELLQEVTRYCTLHALISLGFVNRFATLLVSSSHPYTLIAAHTPKLLATLLQTDTAFYYTAAQVWDVVCSPMCCVCGSYGQYLYMPECVRCCERCLRRSPRFWPITPYTMEKAYGMSEPMLRRAGVPIIKSLPGERITENKVSVDWRVSFHYMSERAAWEEAVRWHGREDVLMRYVNRRPLAKQLHETRLYGIDWYINEEEHESRYRATTNLPYFDQATKTIERGICCKGCKETVRRLYNSNVHSIYWSDSDREAVKMSGRAYTRKSFLEHIRKCPESIASLKSRGKKLPEDDANTGGT